MQGHRLIELFEEDQRARMHHPHAGTDEYRALRRDDAMRREEARGLIRDEERLSGEELYCAAMIFQHSDALEDIDTAHRLARRAAESGYRPARGLAASSLDRWLMYQGRPQKYGTNIVPDGRRQRVWDVDPRTSDDERAIWDVPPLEEMHRRAERVTREEPMPPMEEAPAWLKEAIDRWKAEDRW
jgi:hypothetical protein